MKDLLHNKNFKKRLIKWTILYCMVICLFAVVATYSKYVSSLSANSNGRAAKFNVDIDQGISCDEMVNITPYNISCFDRDSSAVRPKEKVGFYFTLDTSDLEVSSKIVLTTKINEEKLAYFKALKLYDVTYFYDHKEEIQGKMEFEVFEKAVTSLDISLKSENTNNIFEYIEDYEIKDSDKLRKHLYMLVLDYDYIDNYDEDNNKYIGLDSVDEFISVGYSATQID